MYNRCPGSNLPGRNLLSLIQYSSRFLCINSLSVQDFSCSERIFSFSHRYTSDFVFQNGFILIEGFISDVPFAQQYASFASAFAKW